jgi:hypothetical protein
MEANMKWYKRLFYYIRKNKLPEPECKHDWYTPDAPPEYYKYTRNSTWLDKYITADRFKEIEQEDRSSRRYNCRWDYSATKKKVCLNCGECYDEDKIAAQWIDANNLKKKIAKQEAEKRHEIGERMWKDKCDG